MNDFSPDARPDPVARARELGPAIEAAADEIERTQRIPEPLLSQLHAARLCRMLLPRSVDGDELEPWVYLRAIEEISRHDGSVGWNVFVANSSALIAPFLPPEAMRTIFADPRAVVAWGPPNASKAIAVPGGYRVTGRWNFASGCRQATWMGAHCHVVEPDGSLRLNAAGRPTVRTLLCPVAQATLLDDTWNVIGMRGTMSGSYRLDDVFVPEAFSGTREDPTLRREPGRLYAYPDAGPLCRRRRRRGAWASHARCWTHSRTWRRARPRAISAGWPTTRWCSRTSRRWRRGWARRAPIWWRRCRASGRPTTAWVIDVPARARVRLGCAFAIQTAEAVADYAYKAAGTRCDLPRHRVRAAVPRHPHAVAADPVAHRAF